MPSGNWRILVAIAGLALAGAGPPNEQAPQRDAADQTAIAPSPSAGYSPYPDKAADACYEADNHDAADLCAQWRSATAAEETANLSWWGNALDGGGAFLTLLSIGLIVWTLILTRNQLKITEADRNEARAEGAKLAQTTASALAQATRSADAAADLVKETRAAIGHAKAANETTRENMERQIALTASAQRAWLVIEPKIVAGRSRAGGFAIEWRVDFRNIGKTMARDVAYRAVAAHMSYPNVMEEIKSSLDSIQLAPDYRSDSIIPQEHVWLGVKSKRQFDELPWDENGRCVFVVTARADYCIDGSDQIHTTARAFAIGFNDKSMFRNRTIEKSDITVGFRKDRLDILAWGPTIST